ncbi:MAG: GldG family protein [Nevskiales bacterium]|nr:GldG family protein [Nevskiales bacterium]
MQKQKRALLLQQTVSVLLVVAVLVMLGWLSTRYKLDADWTAGHRNTLTDASRKQLESMSGPIKFLAFIYPRSELRQSLEMDLDRYRRLKSDVVLEFIDPSLQPQKVRDYNVSRAGEVVVEYQGRHETLSGTTERLITPALQRLAYAGERWIVFLEGHGEPGLDEEGRGGYSAFAKALRDKGLKVRGLNLATDPRIPDNTSVLVVARPARPVLAGEAQLIADYLARGGNLLWLNDPDVESGLNAVAQALGVNWQKGTAILLESATLGLPPFVYITTVYPPNPVTRDFEENALFPLVRGLSARSDSDWAVQPLLTTTEKSWLETGRLEGPLRHDPEQGDTAGPLTLGLTLTRDLKKANPGPEPAAEKSESTPQRVAVIGDSDFLSNGYIEQLSNGLLGLNLVQWLASRDAQLNIDIPEAPDRSLLLPPWSAYAIYIGFSFLLPAGLLGFGVTRWILRRRR